MRSFGKAKRHVGQLQRRQLDLQIHDRADPGAGGGKRGK
jgi:hypothetical protein